MTDAVCSRMGKAVGVQISPVSSSRRKMASPGGSHTGSFDQGVSWFSRLLPAHVNPDPDSVTRNPNRGFATTFDQGAGVFSPRPRTVTYSDAFSSNPPSPFQKLVSGRGVGTSRGGGDGARAAGGRGAGRFGSERTTCSASVPWLERTTRAAAASAS